MELVQASSIITLAKQMADMENSSFVSDAEWLSYLNLAYRRFWNKVTTLYSDYNVKSANISIVAGTSEYTMPTDLLKFRLVEIISGTQQNKTLWPLDLNEKNRYSADLYGAPCRYSIYDQKIRLHPEPSGSDTLKIWYVPVATPITATSQTVDVISGYDEYIAATMAVKALLKEESDPSGAQAIADRLATEMEQTARERNAGLPSVMTDVAAINDFLGF
jgi:hypothetical protein